MRRLVIIFFLAVLLKSYLNYSKFRKAKKILNEHKPYMDNIENNYYQYIPQAQKLLTETRLHTRQIIITYPVGYDMVASSTVSVIDNLYSRHPDIANNIALVFIELTNTYKTRMSEALSPAYWIETVMFLPSRIVDYLGCSPDNVATKLLQILYWLITPILVSFRTELYQIIVTLAKDFLQII